MSDISDSQLQSAIDSLHSSANRFSQAAQEVQAKAQYLNGIALNITYSASDWKGAGSAAFQQAWSQYDSDANKAVAALNSTSDALNKLAQKLQDALNAKKQAEAEQGFMMFATIGLGILDIAQLGLDPATDAATAAAIGGDVALSAATDIGEVVAEADIEAGTEIAGIETTDVGTLDTLDEGSLDYMGDGNIDVGSDTSGIPPDENVPPEDLPPDENPPGGPGDPGPPDDGNGGGGNNGGNGGDEPGGNPDKPPYPDPENIQNPVGRRYAIRMQNAIDDHLTPEDLQGAWRDLHGDPVPDPNNPGEYYDHLGEVNDAQNSLRNAIQQFKDLLDDPSLSSNDRSIIQTLLSRASKTLDYVDKVINRDQWFPGTHIP